MVDKRLKAPKGTVKVELDKEWLRLRFSHAGKRYSFALGLADNSVNQRIARDKAARIELDILSQNFDETLAKYKPQRVSGSGVNSLAVGELFQWFIQEKSKSVHGRTIEKYTAILRHLEKFQPAGKEALATQPVELLGMPEAESFCEYLTGQLADRTLKESLGLLAACWQWGLSSQLWDGQFNPWQELSKRVKPSPKQRPKPFSLDEIHAIVQAFREDRYYSRYLDYVEFLIGTGCRLGEAAGLRWGHLAEDCSTVWIGESLSRGTRKATKTNKDRTFRLNPRLQTMLASKKPLNAHPDDLVFKSPQGKAIDDHNFRNRAWKTVLAKAGVEYRKPYNTRHSAISHALNAGIAPTAVAEMTGHNVKVLYQHYAGSVQKSPMMPDLLGEG